MTPFPVELYTAQCARWPQSGRHILAHFDESTIVVYQAYRSSAGEFAVAHQRFGRDFSYRRMSWIKPNFLWMMYRSDWGRSEGQTVVLAVRLRRTFFESLLEQAVGSSFDPARHVDQTAWQQAVEQSDVRLQWDPDHQPSGEPTARRAIQIGLRGAALESYGQREIMEIADISNFVAQQRAVLDRGDENDLLLLLERVYQPSSAAAVHVGLD
ncbi:MAG: DUF4291 domain-containing protein [Pirellulales bacterium]